MSVPAAVRLVSLAFLLCAGACAEPDPEHLPDAVLRRELGLTENDRVHSIRIAGGNAEVAEPDLDSVPIGAFVEFVTTDWLVHEVIFQGDSMAADARGFLERTEQVASPPMLQRDSRFVVSFDGAPPGRYPFVMEGNGRPGHGVLIVFDPDATGSPRSR